jgi:hypothetical protein
MLSFRLWLFSGAIPRGCSTLRLLRCFPHAQGWVYPCVIMHVSSARLSPCGGLVCQGVAMCVFANHPCFAAHRPWLFRRVRDRWKTFPFFMGPHVCWPASVSARRTVVYVPRFLSSGFFSASWFLVIVAFHVCPGLPTVALWVSWPALLRFCVGRSSSPPQCVSHPLLSVLHLARCLSPGAPPRR